MARLRYYISAHGLGHASRSCRIIAALRRRHPQLDVEVVTAAPDWFLETSLEPGVTVRRQALDVGVVQKNALELDAEETLTAWRRLLARRRRLVEEEASSLCRRRVTLVVADIPALPFAAARQAGIAAVALANFSWDWICDHLGKRLSGFEEIAESLREDYRLADLLLRLPFHGDFSAFRRVEDLPLVARRATADPVATRDHLVLPEGLKLGLISFGGFAPPDLDLSSLTRLRDWTFLAEPNLAGRWPFLRPLPADLSYPDLVAAADAVITKPGYGIVSECLANRTSVLYSSRGDFPEEEKLVEGLKRFGRAVEIDGTQLRRGEWSEALARLVGLPEPAETLAAHGEETAADRLAGLAAADHP